MAEQGGGNLNEGDATLIGGGSKAGKIADYATAESKDGGASIGMMLQQASVDLLERFIIFVLFAVGQDDVANANAELLAGCLNGIKVKRGNSLITDDNGFTTDMRADMFG